MFPDLMLLEVLDLVMTMLVQPNIITGMTVGQSILADMENTFITTSEMTILYVAFGSFKIYRMLLSCARAESTVPGRTRPDHITRKFLFFNDHYLISLICKVRSGHGTGWSGSDDQHVNVLHSTRFIRSSNSFLSIN